MSLLRYQFFSLQRVGHVRHGVVRARSRTSLPDLAAKATMLPCWFVLCAAIMYVSHSHADAPWRSVRGTELRAIFADRELADGVHYAYRFPNDGTFSGFNMCTKVTGAWRVADDEFCWTLDRRGAEEERYQIESRGRSIRLLRDGYEAFSATVTKVNAQSEEAK